jgi:hypothetical protein
VVAAAVLGACSKAPSTPLEAELNGVVVQSSVSVEPTYRKDIHDYNVWCAEGENTVTLTAQGGGELPRAYVSKWGSEDREVAAQATTLTATVEPGELLNVGSYHFRCLPADFPRLKAEGEIPGGAWVAIGLIESRDTAHDQSNPRLGEYAAILDHHGAVVWYQKANTPVNVTPVDAGHVAWFSDTAQMGMNLDPNKAFEIHSLTGDHVQLVRGPDGWAVDFHELQFKDGKMYGIVTQIREEQAGYDARVIIDGIAEITPGHEALLFDSSDHLDPLETDRGVIPIDVPVVEPVHMNSVQVLENGDFLVCSRNLNEVFLVSGKTKKVTWRMRGDGAAPIRGNLDGAVVLNVPESDRFRNAHDARLNTDGTLSVFDNHTASPLNARVGVYLLDIAKAEASAVLLRSGDNPSNSVGSARSFNKGFVVSWGSSISPLVEMLDKDGLLLFSVRGDGGMLTYRAIPVEKSFFDADVLRGSVK